MKADEKRRIEELAQLLDGGLPDSEAPEDIRQLASLATAVRDEVEVPVPTPAFKAALRTELLQGVAARQVSLLDRVRDAVWERTARWRHSAKLLVATATASSMLGTAGVAVAAQQALPGELLYPVKQVTEDVRMGFASGFLETGRLHLTFATERLEELTEGLDSYDADTVIGLLADMDDETLAGTEDLLRAYEETGSELILVVLERFAEQQRNGLSAIFEELPFEASPFVDRSFEILRRIEVKLESLTRSCELCGARGSGGGPFAINAPGEGPATGDAICDCIAFLPSTLARDVTSRLEGALSEGGDDSTESDTGDGDLDEEITVTIPTLPSPIEGAARTLENAISTLTGGGGGTTTGTIEDTTSDTTGTIDDTTSDVTDTVDDASGTIDDTTSETTDTVDDTTSGTTGTVDDLLSDPTEDTTLP